MYSITKWVTRNGLRMYFRKLHMEGMHHIPESGSALLVANHPNAFLDALLIAAFMKRPIHFLARGDAFNNPVFGGILKSFNLLPVYRISEGKENIGKNTSTFDATQEILSKQGIVLIFGEGWCVQNWDLRPLKKGSARIAERAWSEAQTENMVIIPIGLTYEHFEGGGKSVVMKFGEAITRAENTEQESGAPFVKWLNNTLTARLKTLAYVNSSMESLSAAHHQLMHNWKHAERHNLNILETLHRPQANIEPTPAPLFATTFHRALVTLPHYWTMQRVSKLFTNGTVFYDSVLFALVVLLLPFYIGTLAYLIVSLLY